MGVQVHVPHFDTYTYGHWLTPPPPFFGTSIGMQPLHERDVNQI